MNVLILDIESQGLAITDRVVEVGAILWSVTHATTIAAYSTLVDQSSNAAHHVNRIPPAALGEGADEVSVWTRLSGWLERAEFLVSHNASFDRRFCPPGWDQGKPFICTMEDIAWPQPARSKALVNILLNHGLGVVDAHRALTDCWHLARLLERVAEMGHDVEDMLRQAARPKVLYRAVVSYEDRDKAKASGFTWDGKHWTKRVAPENASAFPFSVVAV